MEVSTDSAATTPGRRAVGERVRAGDLGANLLPLEIEVRRHGGQRREKRRGLEDENRRLKHLVADLTLDTKRSGVEWQDARGGPCNRVQDGSPKARAPAHAPTP